MEKQTVLTITADMLDSDGYWPEYSLSHNGPIFTDGALRVRGSIRTPSFVEAGESVETGGDVEAGGGVVAGTFVEAGGPITTGVDYGVWAGVGAPWSEPDWRTVTCTELVGGPVRYGELVLVDATGNRS